MWMRVIGVAVALIGVGSACFEEQPCDRYVEYVCDCHAGEEDFDCEEIARALGGAEPGVQDQCAVDLAALQESDDASGHVCVADAG